MEGRPQPTTWLQAEDLRLQSFSEHLYTVGTKISDETLLTSDKPYTMVFKYVQWFWFVQTYLIQWFMMV